MPRKNYIQIKASDQEKASWIAQAYHEGKTLSDFARDRLNGERMKSDKRGLKFLCNYPADKVEEKFGSDVWTGRPLIISTGEVDTMLEDKDVVAVYRLEKE